MTPVHSTAAGSSAATHLLLVLVSFHSLVSVLALPAHQHHESHLHRHSLLGNRSTCINEAYDPFDYSAKPARDRSIPLCPKDSKESVIRDRDAAAAVHARDLLTGRQVTQQTDYSCSETKPCGNVGPGECMCELCCADASSTTQGACCPKETGWCNYGPKACGTTGTSPNDVCWSNCDAKAECGRYADPPGKKCPLNVCCSPWGFCGMTKEFCAKTDDDETSCQSNCDQPTSGSSGSNIRKRVVGYYEAWVHERKCNGMSIEQIPVGALTHLMFSFAYITPNDFQIVPMDDLKPNLFSKMTALKSRNKALKVMVALGGWTFNDPGPTQRVFHDVAKTKANRARFIGNLMSFMRQYAFDGVDFDWEYPGAEDRGGEKGDGDNFTLLLEELRSAIKAQPLDYVVSFTTPTSYWYLRHFDIKASTDAVDFVNIMSYDLHGVWDAWNPIGSQVLAHTNITEIELALDLYWRNKIPPEKLNLGFGFYGRSFQLSDPTCHKPGCQFLGGASPGPCTKNSGTLAYREIVNIIEKNKLKPYYDKKAQVKYIVWNQDQWISYDDEETIAAKIKFANQQGLGGLLIWSLDQDTDDLSALSAVVGPQVMDLAMNLRTSDDASYWQDVGAQNCYVTDCGGKCKSGFKPVETQPCGSAHWFTRRSQDDDSTLCCPLTATPDPDDCSWRSADPECNGRCDNDEVLMQLNKWGDGKYCENGHKAYCCKTALEKSNGCEWQTRGDSCKSGQQPLTFAGIFYEDDVDLEKLYKLKGSALAEAVKGFDLWDVTLYCCPPEDLKRWNNCEWKGKPGNCFDGHCDVNTQVQLEWHMFGGSKGCFPRLDRTRIFCCDPPKGESLFLPVPLDDLFPNPPSGNDVDTDFDLKVDDTWGGSEGGDGSGDPEPGDASFQFYVLAAPDEISTSLDKRDGSHWDVFNCNDAVSEGEHTVQMVCTNDSEESNCGHIFKGLGAEGTIVQMPQGQGCGPGKYAVVKRLEVAQNQTVPKRLVKRGKKYGKLVGSGGGGVVYDLTFDYDFTRVPRDFGDTQLRVDFSNQDNYWDKIVKAPANKKIKRSLDSVGGNHKRWLEEEWRDDLHFGALSREDFHKRWFGDSVLEWLKGLLHIDISKDKRHDYEDEVQAIILQEEWKCGSFNAKVDAVATAGISMSTSFGFTLITTLGPNMNLDNSFLHFNNEGKIESVFTLDAIARVDWDSDVINIVTLPIPGGTFNIPGILTIGPRLDLDARFKAGISVSGRVEARVTLSEWEIRQTYPQESGYQPFEEKKSARDFNRKFLADPSFDASLVADGYAEAHLLPSVVFGIKFNKAYGIDEAGVSLVADGWARMRVHSDLVGGDCAFGYRIEAGCKLTASADVPDVFNWNPKPFEFGKLDKQLVPSNGDKEWECLSVSSRRDTLESGLEALERVRNISSLLSWTTTPSSPAGTGIGLHKRLVPYGPVISLPKFEKFCPTDQTEIEPKECHDIFAADGMYNFPDEDDEFIMKRDVAVDWQQEDKADWDAFNQDADVSLKELQQRALSGKKRLKICYTLGSHGRKEGGHFVSIPAWDVKTYKILDNDDWHDCNNYAFGVQASLTTDVKNKHWNNKLPANTKIKQFVDYKVEHVLEGNQLDKFFLDNRDLCAPMRTGGWYRTHDIDGSNLYPWNYIAAAYPYHGSNDDEFYTVIEPLNIIKENAFMGNALPGESDMPRLITKEASLDEAIKTVKMVLMTYKYMARDTVKTILQTQADRVGNRMEKMDRLFAAKSDSSWDYKGMKRKWRSFIKGNTDRAVAKLKTFVEDWTERIEGALEADTSNDDQVPGRAELREKIAKLREAVANKPAWSSPW